MIHFHPDLRLVDMDGEPKREENYIQSDTDQVHASNLLVLDSGEVLCAFFGGSMEGASDICIWLARLAPGADEWSEPARVSDDPGRSGQNPVLFEDPRTKNLWLLYTAQEHGAQNKCLVRRRVSTDQGRTWSEAREAFSDSGVFVRQPVMVLPDKEGPGRDVWVLPVFHCRAAEGEEWVGNDDVSAVRYSADGGETWKESVVPDSRGAVHMNIRPDPGPEGGWVAVFRSRWADSIYMSRSQDCITWSKPQPTELPNPNSGIGMAVTKGGRLALVYNDSRATPDTARREGLYDDLETGEPKLSKQAVTDGKPAIWGTPRNRLTLATSDDGGRTWKTQGLLGDGLGFCLTNNSKGQRNRELSHPSIAVAADGTIHIAYTFWRMRIKYCRIKEEDLK
ncbi:hypothetical protein RB594_002500 [Gaeumannomyces avenae]